MKSWNPSYYDNHSDLQFRTSLVMLAELKLYGNETIVDIGCGTGRIASYLAKMVPNGSVIGVDISEQMISYARETYTDENLSFVHKDVLEIEYEMCFDVAVSFWTLSWISNQSRALQNMFRSLKEGGRFILMYPMRHDIYDIVDRVIISPEWCEHFENGIQHRPFFSENEYRTIVNSFSDTYSVTMKCIPYEYETYDAMIDSMLSWLKASDEIHDENEKREFIKTIANKYLTYRDEPPGKYVVYFSVLEVSGMKIENQGRLLCEHGNDDNILPDNFLHRMHI